jgi:cytochrome b561
MNRAAPTPARYTATAIALHWLLVAALLGSWSVGFYMSDLPLSPTKLKLYNWHKWAGISILLLSALRLAWRLTHTPPPDGPMPLWQARAAHLAHGLLYVLFFAVPLSGWAYTSAAGFPVVWFGVLPLPDWVSPNRELAELLKTAHKLLTLLLAATVLAHVAGAFKHQFIDKDGLLSRMGLGRS